MAFSRFFCEVPIDGSRDYGLKATAFGSKLEVYHYEEIKEDMKAFDVLMSGITEERFDKLIDRMLSGTVRRSELYFAMMRGTSAPSGALLLCRIRKWREKKIAQ